MGLMAVLYFHDNSLFGFDYLCLLCFSRRIPRLSLIQHSLYIRVVETSPPLPLTGEQYGKMEPKYPKGGHCLNGLHPQGVFNIPPLILIIIIYRTSNL